MFGTDNPHYSVGEQLECVDEADPSNRLTLTVHAPAGLGSFASVWAVTATVGAAHTGLLAARTAWAPNHWMTDHSSALRRLDRYRGVVALTQPSAPIRALLSGPSGPAGVDEVIPGLVTHYGLYVSAHAARGQDVYVALMPYFPMTIAQILGGPAGGMVTTRIAAQTFAAPAQPRGFPYAQALRTAQTIAGGIDALHRRELIHRDISCDNTLARPDGTAVVGDLNLAALLTEGHYRGSLDRGKGFYSPPEMLRAEQTGRPPDLTKASDVWQLGVLLSRLFTGSWPYPTNNWQEFEQLCLVPPGPATLAPGLRALPGPVRDLIIGCLDPEPANRPTIGDVRARLAAASPAAAPSVRDNRRRVTEPPAPAPASATPAAQPTPRPASQASQPASQPAGTATDTLERPLAAIRQQLAVVGRQAANIAVFTLGAVLAVMLATLILGAIL